MDPLDWISISEKEGATAGRGKSIDVLASGLSVALQNLTPSASRYRHLNMG